MLNEVKNPECYVMLLICDFKKNWILHFALLRSE